MEMNIKDFEYQIKNRNSAILLGNGFSINFDRCFSNIYDRLYNAHTKLVKKEIEYRIIDANKKFKDKFKNNYMNVLRKHKFFSEADLRRLFQDGLELANYINNSEKLIEELRKNNHVTELVFGISQIDLLKNICEVGNTKGYNYVNIENWTILIYFYLCVKDLDHKGCSLPMENSFLKAIEYGELTSYYLTETNDEKDKLLEKTITNGFSQYLRFLFLIAIYSDGKALDIQKLDNINYLNLDGIKLFLNNFNAIISLNYDHITDLLLPERKVIHPHGTYVKNKREFNYHQSIGFLDEKGQYISCSDLIIGDYFIYKTKYPVINDNAVKFSSYNKRKPSFMKDLVRESKEKNVDTFVFFGINIENDYHILRNIMNSFYERKISDPRIIFCYFNDFDKESFEEMFDKVITFGKDMSDYSRSIKIDYQNTMHLLKEYFKLSSCVN
ncbi:hypothetical protein MOB34_05680 [Bacillus spizizenii]|nr:hypothetical protein [Bacillus spizizenii]MCY8229288.1 hypothetical protein [Bacillus spizizenii]MCY8888138.1 hypothetical protein [Bacillus spizizenii]MEC0840282.1 hypothetical protein [Bacillus spizizenii]